MAIPTNILPQQAPVLSDRLMKAPYNFVPLPAAVYPVAAETIPPHDHYDSTRHTGFIELDIKTETLLYTRCAYRPALADTKVYLTPERQEFFHHGNPAQPVIPGSSLRGMLRTLVEIIGFGKMTAVFDEKLIYRAVAESTSLGKAYRERMLGTGNPLSYPSVNLKGGYLHRDPRGHWHIRPAVEYYGESFIHTRTYPPFAQARDPKKKYGPDDLVDVWVLPPTARYARPGTPPKPNLFLADIPATSTHIIKRTPTNDAPICFVPAVLVRSGHLGSKHMHCIIYEEDPDASKKIPVPDEIRRMYEDDRGINRGIECRKLYANGEPIFYLIDPAAISNDNPKGLIFFGPTMMFRIPYNHSVNNFIPDFFQNSDVTDLAEAIFGTTSRKGRVRFSDAKLVPVTDNGSPFLENQNSGRIIPKILSNPKPTSFQNYLVQPLRASAYPQIPNNNKKSLLLHYDHPLPGTYQLPVDQNDPNAVVPTTGTTIRGYKLYWNKNGLPDSVSENPELAQCDQNGRLFQYRLREDRPWNNTNNPNKTPQQTVIRPVRPGRRFRAKIYFENLSGIELGALLTALKLKDESRHRIGMGKPYGMGRVRITTRLFRENRQDRYTGWNAASTIELASAEYMTKFQSALQVHWQNNCGGLAGTEFWNIPRIKDLTLLLRNQARTDCDYTPLQPTDPWKERRVLPSPAQVCGEIQPDFVQQGQGGGGHFPAGQNPHKQKGGVHAPAPAQPQLQRDFKSGDTVKCVVLEEKSKKEKWCFQVKDGTGIGMLHPSAEGATPSDIEPGKEYNLVVFSNDPKNMSFKWPSK